MSASKPVLTCGCETDDGHVEPHVDPVLHLRHGERDPSDPDDPPPYFVPGTGGWNGLYNESPDAYCLCGHPNYLSCQRLDGGGMYDVTLHNVGGYFISTLDES